MLRRGFMKLVGGLLAAAAAPWKRTKAIHGWGTTVAIGMDRDGEVITELVNISPVVYDEALGDPNIARGAADISCWAIDGLPITKASLMPPHHDTCRCVAVLDEYGRFPPGYLDEVELTVEVKHDLMLRHPDSFVVISTEPGTNWLKKEVT